MNNKIELDGVRTSVLIAVPTFDSRVDTRCMFSIMNLITKLSQKNIVCSLIFKRGSLINRVRNYVVHEFIELKFSHLLFIDSDVYGFEDVAIKLLESNYDVCGGIYPIKEINEFMYHCNIMEKLPFQKAHKEACDFNINTSKPIPQLIEEADKNNGFVEVDEIATGCMMIKRNVFLKMIEAYPERNFAPLSNSEFMGRSLYNFFDSFIHPKTKYYLSEDYGFCYLWKAIGGSVHAEITTKLNHIGEFVYQGSYYEYLEKFKKYFHLQNKLLNRIECLHSQEKMWISTYDDNLDYFDKTTLLNSSVSSTVMESLLECLDINLTHESITLDLGSGTGETSVYLANKFNCNAEGVDYSKKRLDRSAELVKDMNLIGKVKFYVSDIQYFLNKPESNIYDLITGFQIIERLTDVEKVMNNIMKLLKPNGIFLGVSRLNYDDHEKAIITNFKNKTELKNKLGVKFINPSEPLHDPNLVIFFKRKDKNYNSDLVDVNNVSL